MSRPSETNKCLITCYAQLHESLAIILAACERLGHELREANQSAAANASADVKSPPAFMVGASFSVDRRCGWREARYCPQWMLGTVATQPKRHRRQAVGQYCALWSELQVRPVHRASLPRHQVRWSDNRTIAALSYAKSPQLLPWGFPSPLGMGALQTRGPDTIGA